MIIHAAKLFDELSFRRRRNKILSTDLTNRGVQTQELASTSCEYFFKDPTCMKELYEQLLNPLTSEFAEPTYLELACDFFKESLCKYFLFAGGDGG